MVVDNAGGGGGFAAAHDEVEVEVEVHNAALVAGDTEPIGAPTPPADAAKKPSLKSVIVMDTAGPSVTRVLFPTAPVVPQAPKLPVPEKVLNFICKIP